MVTFLPNYQELYIYTEYHSWSELRSKVALSVSIHGIGEQDDTVFILEKHIERSGNVGVMETDIFHRSETFIPISDLEVLLSDDPYSSMADYLSDKVTGYFRKKYAHVGGDYTARSFFDQLLASAILADKAPVEFRDNVTLQLSNDTNISLDELEVIWRAILDIPEYFNAYGHKPVHRANSTSELYREFEGAVVRISTFQTTGSGFFIDGEGYILTNSHVIN